MPNSRQGTSIRRALEVLLALGADDEDAARGLSVTRLAESLGHDKSQVSRALSVLSEYGLAERIPGERGYRLGWQVHVLSASTGQKHVVEQMAIVMREMAAETGESAFAVVRRGDEFVVVVAEHPPRSVHVRGTVGFSAPLLTSGAGRALLADEDREGFDALCDRSPALRWTTKTVTDHDAIWQRIRAERERGFYINDEEYESELVSVSAPVRRNGGPVLAAVSIAGPRHRVIDQVEEKGAQIVDAAERVASALEGEPSGDPDPV